jgi:PAS domain S-box-containing protein
MPLKRKDNTFQTFSPPLRVLSVAFTLTLFLFVLLGWFCWSSYQEIKKTQEQAFKIFELKGLILQYDEILTMSTKMASATGDLYWEQRYRSFEPQLDEALKELVIIEPNAFAGEGAEQTKAANTKLVTMENTAFTLVREGNADQATLLLSSQEYEREKSIYSSGMTQLQQYLELQAEYLTKEQRRRALFALFAVIVDIPLVLFAWFLTHRSTKMYIAQRKKAEEELRQSEEKFRALADTSPLAIYMSKGVEQKAVYINSTFHTLFGYTTDDVPTVAQWWPLAYPDSDYRKLVAEIWQTKVKKAIETESAIEPMEAVVTCKDGTKKDISWGFITIGKQNWAFGLNLTERKQAEKERETIIKKLQKSLEEIETLRGILPICSICKNIRNDEGYYEQIESYIHKHSGVDFTHTICPSCATIHYPEFKKNSDR